ncbi:MAG TPA: oligosaccharide flippase family protein [Desulfosporosinus sp.]|nr:oligosaccharide flippase family protein [Desulfosporosinus sp.]
MPFNFKSIRNQFFQIWRKGAFHIIIGSFLTKFVSFFGSIFLVRVLSKTSYGVLSYIENIYAYVFIFAGMGLGNALLRYVVLAKTPEHKYGYYRYIQKKSTLFNLILILILGLYAVFYPPPSEFASARWLLVIILIALPFQYLMQNSMLLLRALFANKGYAITAFVTTAILIGSKYVGAVFWDLKGVIVAFIAVNLFFGILFCVMIYKKYFNNIKAQTLSSSEKKIADRYSIQYMITSGIWSIFMLNDVFMLGMFFGDATIVADYKVAYVIPGNLAIISTAIGIFVSPYFVRHESNYEWIRKNYKKVMSLTAGLMALAVLILFVFAKPIITLLYGAQYENVVPIMRLLLIAAFANCGLRFTTANLLAAMGQIKYNMTISFIGVMFQIGINIFMIPRFGAMGAAFTSIVIYTIMALALFSVFVKKYQLFKR